MCRTNSTLTVAEYEEAARRTEPEITPEMRERFKLAYRDIYDILAFLAQTAAQIDALKRFVYYGDTDTIQKLVIEEGNFHYSYGATIRDEIRNKDVSLEQAIVDHATEQTDVLSRWDWDAIPLNVIDATIDLVHSVLGISGETCEIVNDMEEFVDPAFKAQPQGFVNRTPSKRFPILMPMSGIDKLLNLGIEGGDVLWYLPQLLRAINRVAPHGWIPTSLEVMAAANVEKLKARYPKKFSEHDATHRNLSAETEAVINATKGDDE